MSSVIDMMFEGLCCEGCGAELNLDDAEDFEPAGFPKFCKACNEVAGTRRQSRRPRMTQAELGARRRASTEPTFCPYCKRTHQGYGLVLHLRDVHGAQMILVRNREIWPPKAWPTPRARDDN